MPYFYPLIIFILLPLSAVSEVSDWDGELWNTRCLSQLKTLKTSQSIFTPEAKSTNLPQTLNAWLTETKDPRLSFKITSIRPGKDAGTLHTHVLAGRYSSIKKLELI